MICRLCLQDSKNCFNFFESDGLKLKAAIIIGKHFWFQPKVKDESQHICQSCWSITDAFHKLYIIVRNAQNKMNRIKVDNENKYNVTINKSISCIADLMFENESVNNDSGTDNDRQFLSTSEYFQDTLYNFCQDSGEYETLKGTNSKREENEHKNDNEITTEKSKNTKKPNSRKNLGKNKTETCLNLKKKKYKSIDDIKQKKKKIKTESIKKPNQSGIVSDEEIYKMKRITCQLCMIEISTFLELKKHFAEVHDEEGYAICCDKKFYKRYKFVHHLKMHVNPNEYKCPQCNKQLGSKKYVTLHIKNMHTKIEKERNFSCGTCAKSFVQKGALVRHMLTHVPDSEKLFQCDQCEKSFPTQGVLRTHKTTVHEGRYGGICALCGKKYQNPQDLKRHCLEHEGITEPKAQCEICGDWLANKYKLKRHMIKHNTAHLEHRCPHCNKLSPNEVALKSHIKFTHDDNNKIHQCSVCEKAFRRRIDLKEHMTVHTGEHLYTCPHCPRTFTHHSNLHHHRKKMHRKEFDEERIKRGINKSQLISTTGVKKESEFLINPVNEDHLIEQIDVTKIHVGNELY